jgi:hypothetical protein
MSDLLEGSTCVAMVAASLIKMVPLTLSLTEHLLGTQGPRHVVEAGVSLSDTQ